MIMLLKTGRQCKYYALFHQDISDKYMKTLTNFVWHKFAQYLESQRQSGKIMSDGEKKGSETEFIGSGGSLTRPCLHFQPDSH